MMERSLRPAGIWFIGAGSLILAREFLGLFDPAYYDPTTPLDYTAAWLTSVAAIAVAVALIVWWRVSPVRRGSVMVAIAGAGAALFGIGNLLEDVFHVEAGETLFFVGGLTMFGAVIVAGILTLSVAHPLRWSGLFLIGFIAGWGFPDIGGLWVAGSSLIGLGSWLLRQAAVHRTTGSALISSEGVPGKADEAPL